ncbi:MAG TPA: hypothetical protein QGF58_10995 [Myxococcota bacterium]|nr:hypothetical protein [Myxococcota bacterium]
MSFLMLLACTDYNIQPDPPETLEPDPPLPVYVNPVAVAGPGGAVKRWEPIGLDGSESWDPDDEDAELFYRWEVTESPAGTPILTGEYAPDPEFLAGEIGLYVVQLHVEDDDGLTSENYAASLVEVIPWEDLSVTLTWDTAEADLDLHLLQPDGVYFGEGDCFFAQPEPDWGVEGDSSDDPVLDQDSETSETAETITLSRPEEVSYDFLVHFYDPRDSTRNYATPTLTIEAEGSVVAERTGPKLTMGQVWRVGSLDWSGPTFTSDDSTTTHEALGGPDYNL